jgi:hypothetical protein
VLRPRSVAVAKSNGKRLAVLLGGVLLALSYVRGKGDRGKNVELAFVRVITNGLGVREYEFTVRNRVWDSVLDAKVMTCADPERARARVRYHQGARIWPKMQLVDSRIQVASSTGDGLLREKTGVLRFSEPTNGPWMLAVYCVRTNTSSLLLALAAANRVANARFGAPMLITPEWSTGCNSILFDPIEGPASLIERTGSAQ